MPVEFYHFCNHLIGEDGFDFFYEIYENSPDFVEHINNNFKFRYEVLHYYLNNGKKFQNEDFITLFIYISINWNTDEVFFKIYPDLDIRSLQDNDFLYQYVKLENYLNKTELQNVILNYARNIALNL